VKIEEVQFAEDFNQLIIQKITNLISKPLKKPYQALIGLDLELNISVSVTYTTLCTSNPLPLAS
jgi:hypothetical protein